VKILPLHVAHRLPAKLCFKLAARLPIASANFAAAIGRRVAILQQHFDCDCQIWQALPAR